MDKALGVSAEPLRAPPDKCRCASAETLWIQGRQMPRASLIEWVEETVRETKARGDSAGISRAYKESMCFGLLSRMCSVLLFKKTKEPVYNENSVIIVTLIGLH